MILQLTYISTASCILDGAEIERLLGQARSRNEALSLNGVLLFNGVNFLQTLEGSPSSIDTVMTSIRRDQRHSGLVIVLKSEVEVPAFDGWRMGWHPLPRSTADESITARQNAYPVAAMPRRLQPALQQFYASFDTLGG